MPSGSKKRRAAKNKEQEQKSSTLPSVEFRDLLNSINIFIFTCIFLCFIAIVAEIINQKATLGYYTEVVKQSQIQRLLKSENLSDQCVIPVIEDADDKVVSEFLQAFEPLKNGAADEMFVINTANETVHKTSLVVEKVGSERLDKVVESDQIVEKEGSVRCDSNQAIEKTASEMLASILFTNDEQVKKNNTDEVDKEEYRTDAITRSETNLYLEKAGSEIIDEPVKNNATSKVISILDAIKKVFVCEANQSEENSKKMFKEAQNHTESDEDALEKLKSDVQSLQQGSQEKFCDISEIMTSSSQIKRVKEILEELKVGGE